MSTHVLISYLTLSRFNRFCAQLIITAISDYQVKAYLHRCSLLSWKTLKFRWILCCLDVLSCPVINSGLDMRLGKSFVCLVLHLHWPDNMRRFAVSTALAIAAINEGSLHKRAPNVAVGVVLIAPIILLKISACTWFISALTVLRWVPGNQTAVACRYLCLNAALYNQWTIMGLSPQDFLTALLHNQHPVQNLF